MFPESCVSMCLFDFLVEFLVFVNKGFPCFTTFEPSGIDLSVRDNQTWKVKPGLSHFAEHDDLQGKKIGRRVETGFETKG